MDLRSRVDAAAARLKDAGDVLVVSHLDADGLSSGAIAKRALDAAEVPHEWRIVKGLTGDSLVELRKEDRGLYWFVDLGSGMAHELKEWPCVITDHHVASHEGHELHINPTQHGIDGTREASGATTTWLVSRELAPQHEPALAMLGVIGAVGDLQHRETQSLRGLNRNMVQAALDGGQVEPVRDVMWYGRETRPLLRFLQYADDPAVWGVSGSAGGARKLIEGAGAQADSAWVLQSLEARTELTNRAAGLILTREGPKALNRLFGEVYEFPNEKPATALHEAREFATLLNSTARYDRPDVGQALLLGDRGPALQQAHELLAGHRRHLVESVAHVSGLPRWRGAWVEAFDAGNRVRDTVVGIVTGMLLRSEGQRGVLCGLADAGDGNTKASCRAARGLELDLNMAVRDAAAAVGGEGGGHRFAAGATIPAGRSKEFLEHLDRYLQAQLGPRAG